MLCVWLVFGFVALCLLCLASWRCVCGVWLRGVVFVVFGFVALSLVLVARPHSVFRRAFPPASSFLLISLYATFCIASCLVPSQPSFTTVKLQNLRRFQPSKSQPSSSQSVPLGGFRPSARPRRYVALRRPTPTGTTTIMSSNPQSLFTPAPSTFHQVYTATFWNVLGNTITKNGEKSVMEAYFIVRNTAREMHSVKIRIYCRSTFLKKFGIFPNDVRVLYL